MFLKHLNLLNFRNYDKAEFNFTEKINFIVGANTSGKTNLVEAIYFLARGTSFRAEKDSEAVRFGENIARVKGKIAEIVEDEGIDLEVVINNLKRYLVNGVAKRKADFVGNFSAVLFSPQDLDIIIGLPSLRRKLLDSVLEQVDREYRLANSAFSKALRQRNALLELVQELGVRNEKQFEYWDDILIENGQMITQKRNQFIEFVNNEEKEIIDFAAFYDKSVISKERLAEYKDAEIGAGVTLIGPQRDDFHIQIFDNARQSTHNVKLFGSRGQQRLVILQLKFLELLFVEKKLGSRPTLLLDDIFSELDNEHIELVLGMIGNQQTIITTTHKEFIPGKIKGKMNLIELNGKNN